MSDCPFARRLGAYHDGELDADERAVVERHAEGCPACAGELSRLRRLSQLLAAPAAAAPSQAAMQRFHATAQAAAAGPFRRLVEVLTATAAAILVGCGAALWAASVGGGPGEAMPTWEETAMERPADAALASAEEQTAAWVVEDLSRESGHAQK